MRVQLESELLASLDIPPKKLVQWADQKLGLQLVLLDWREKARQAYFGCIGAVPKKLQQGKHLVISIEEEQTLFSFGQGMTWNREMTLRLLLGLEQVFLENPLDIIDVALARNEIAKKLEAEFQPKPDSISYRQSVYLTRHPAVDTIFLDIERLRRPGGLGLERTGLDSFLLQWYLGQTGLKFLEKQVNRKRLSVENARLLLKRLIVLAELGKICNLTRYHFGAENGSTRAVFEELARNQIVRRAQTFGATLAQDAQARYTQMEEILGRIFPSQSLHGRIKTQSSITDKLTRKAMRREAPVYFMRNLNEATELVSDGVGFCLVLEDASPSRIEQVCDALVFALRNEQIQILELKNYRGMGEHAMPYLSSMDIHRIERCIQAQEEHPPLRISDDANAVKRSGYTTAQFVLRLKNPETDAFDLPPCELQVRGKMVDAFYTIEHSIRDIRLGKRDALQESDLSQEHIALFDAVSQLDNAQFESLLDYLNAFYGYCRRVENHLPAEVPAKPEVLSEVFKLDRLLAEEPELAGI